jgi:protein O-GlcNAc transferase
MATSRDVNAELEKVREAAGRGQIFEAETICRQVIELWPDEPEGWAWLGILLSALQKWSEAELAIRKAIERRDGHAPYWSYLSAAVRNLGHYADAEKYAQTAIDLDSSQPSYWSNLAAAIASQGRLTEAADTYRKAVSLSPNDAAIWLALATTEQDAGNVDAAYAAFERSWQLAPDGPASVGLAYLLSQRGHHQPALRLLTDYVARVPQHPAAWTILTHVYLQVNALPQAEHACRRARELWPQRVEPRFQLAEILLKQWRVKEAEAEAKSLVEEEPQYGEGWKIYGLALGARGAQQESLAALRRALELQPSAVTHSKVLCSMHYAEGLNAEEILRAHVEWPIAYEYPFRPSSPPPVTWQPGRRKLRLGFVSIDFNEHAIGFLALPLLEHLDKSACTVVCYADGPRNDAYTARFRAAADEWRVTLGTADEVLAEHISRDAIDVLFDLTGHFGNRLSVFARKLAPIQITWLGYVGTTGLVSMDYLLADRFHIATGEEKYYSEKVLRMPHGYVCYGPPAQSPPVAPLAALMQGYVTFGCFNNPAKFTAGILNAWASILSQVPDSRLLLKYCWQDTKDLKSWLQSEFVSRGIAAKRIVVPGSSPQLEAMASYGQVDLALDTQPYSGGLTTCEALWMGVPVITYPGKTFASRHSVSHLSNAGYSQFIASDADQYVKLAVSWAHRLDELAVLRAQMREQVRLSPLCDARRFADDFLALISNACASRTA